VQDSREDLKKTLNRARRAAKKSAYQTPVVTDYGDVARLTQGRGTSVDQGAAQGFNKHPYI
jgi:hypothetical protein